MLFEEISVEEFAEIRAREAYDIGRSEGEQSGAPQEKREIAGKMLKEGMKPDLITKLTGLSFAEVEAL